MKFVVEMTNEKGERYQTMPFRDRVGAELFVDMVQACNVGWDQAPMILEQADEEKP